MKTLRIDGNIWDYELAPLTNQMQPHEKVFWMGNSI